MKRILALGTLSYTACALSTFAMEEPTDYRSHSRHMRTSSSILPTRHQTATPSDTLQLYQQGDSIIKAAQLIKSGLELKRQRFSQSTPPRFDNPPCGSAKLFFEAWLQIERTKQNLPTEAYFVELITRHIPPLVKTCAPAKIIMAADIMPDDSLVNLAHKLKKLGILILNLSPEEMLSNSYSRETLAAHCFMYAGRRIEDLIQQENLTLERNAIDIEEASALAQSFYVKAIENLNGQAKSLMEKRVEDLQRKINSARHYQLFQNLRSGFAHIGEHEMPAPPVTGMSNVIQELKEKIDSGQLTEGLQTPSDEARLAEIQHFLPESALSYLSIDTLLQIKLEPHDSPYLQAFKLSKLAMNIKFSPPELTHHSTGQDNDAIIRTIIADTYMLAGNNLSEAVRLQKEHSNKPLAPELLMDTSMTAGQFYMWAAANMQDPVQAYSNALGAFMVTAGSVIETPLENYDWRVIGDQTLREVLLENLGKIINLAQSIS